MNPIATYSEVRFEASRTFSLFADRIVIRGKETLASDGETGIPLSLLEPHFDQLRIRSKVCLQGIIMAAVFFFICYVLGSKFAMTFADPILVVLLIVGVAGLILAATTARKVQFVFFKNHSGVVLLTIARAGKQQDQFDSFVATLVRQIELANGSKATG